MTPTDTPHRRSSSKSSHEWKLLPLLAVPLACCALPAIVASVAAIGVLAWTLGLGAAAAVAVATVVFTARHRSRIRCAADHPDRPPLPRP